MKCAVGGSSRADIDLAGTFRSGPSSGVAVARVYAATLFYKFFLPPLAILLPGFNYERVCTMNGNTIIVVALE